jgi:succinate-semialdehyde dehydrogenase / glutarate-semialdehyde dehydrogenase
VTGAPNRLFIAGEWSAAGDGSEVPILDPSTEEEIDRIPSATAADLDRALDAAVDGYHVWREVDAWTRSQTLRRIAELVRQRELTIARVMTEEQGKPLAEARSEVLAAADQFDWYADEARRCYGRTVDGHTREVRLLVLRQPIGPVAAFTAWNFPALLPARKLAPALAAGCSIILKPAEEAPRSALSLAQACHDAGVPSGVVNVVTGDPAAISRHLIGSGRLRKVSLTGSLAVGRTLLRQCAEEILPITLELGGHAPVLVFEDADVEVAAETCVRAKFRNTGQVCISPTRFFVHERLVESFTEAVVAHVRRLKVGPGLDPTTEVGPLANARRRAAVEALVNDAVATGAEVRAGGGIPADRPHGYYYQPTVLTRLSERARVLSDEPFGPILPILPFADFDEGVRRANDTPYGLAGYVFTARTRTAILAAEALDVGMVGVNNLVIATAEAPFGGVKQSGFGREGGLEGLDAYTVPKYVNLRL